MAKIKTKPLDVVYFVSAYPNSDLLYSIRSVAENLEFNKLWIYGGKRSEIKPDEYVERRNQKGATKWARVRNMYLEVCQNDNITEDFILFHDDFFVLKPTKSLEPEYLGTLIENAEMIEKKFDGNKSSYTKILRNADKLLKDLGYPALSYELHKPFVFNREKFLKILKDYPMANCMRSIYANVYGVKGKKAKDVKIPDKQSGIFSLPENTDFVSTNNDSFAYGEIGHWLRDRFSSRCKYEM